MVFAERTGNKIADRILWELRREPRGILKNDLYRNVLGGNYPVVHLEMALALLLELNLVRWTPKET